MRDVTAIVLCRAAVVLLGLDVSGQLTGQLQQLWGALSAWTATLLFCCQPIAQLTANFVRPEGAASLSLATVLLATLGNGMMVPRALLTQDVIWLTGTVWGSLAMGWGNMLSMALAKHAHGYGHAPPAKPPLAVAALLSDAACSHHGSHCENRLRPWTPDAAASHRHAPAVRVPHVHRTGVVPRRARVQT